MKRNLLISLCVACLPLAAAGAEPLLFKQPEDAAAVTKRAAAALMAPIVRVTDKDGPSPTGDARDYVSYSRFWWPDPSKKDGFPFVRHDGRHNMEYVAKGDLNRTERFADIVEALAAGWRATGDERFALRAGEWIRAWWITPESRMNPNLEYSQVRLGHDDNRGNKAGLLDGRRFIRVIDAVRMLEDSGALNAEEQEAATQWCGRFYEWFISSKLGKLEAASLNNHGTWYFVQALAFARHLGLEQDARKHCESARRLIRSQIRPDGSQLLELARADGLGYCVFNLEAHLSLALLARPLGVELLDWVPEKGGGLRKAIAQVEPYNATPEKWPHSWDANKIKPGFFDNALALIKRLEAAP